MIFPIGRVLKFLVRQRHGYLTSTQLTWGSPLQKKFYVTAVTKEARQSTIQLRQYQEECIQAVVHHIGQGKKRLGVSLATGAGKTVVFTQLIDRVHHQSDMARQTLILAHRQELVEQAAKHCRNAYPTKSIDVEMGSIHASGFADITIASVQSIISGDRLSKFDPTRFKLILVDEAHHIVAPGYMKTLAHFGLVTAPNSTGLDESFVISSDAPVLVGVSATLSRFDGVKLGSALDEIVYHKDYIDMIEEKWLSDVIFTTVESKADIRRVKAGPTGDFQSSELSRVINTKEINTTTVRSWIAKAEARKSTLVFCVDVAHVVELTKAFREHGIDARYVTGETPRAERSARLDAFRSGEFKVLLNCGVFTEGTDVPNIDCVLLARPTKSRNLLVQMIGRGMRLHPGKVNCHIIDMVASLATGIVTVPTLFGLDPSELVNEVSAADLRDLERRRQEDKTDIAPVYDTPTQQSLAGPSKVIFTDYDSVYDFIGDSSGEKHIRSISNYAWVMVGDDKYILSSSTGRYLKLEKTDSTTGELYAVYEVVPNTPIIGGGKSASPLRRPRLIASAITFQDAVHAADTFAAERYLHRLISRTERWRNSPATDGQLMFLNKLRPQDDQLTAEMLTKGKAGDMITKMKHGAKGQFAKVEARRKKEQRLQMRTISEQSLQGRERVTVGPIAG